MNSTASIFYLLRPLIFSTPESQAQKNRGLGPRFFESGFRSDGANLRRLHALGATGCNELDLLAFGEISLDDTDDAYGVAADFILRDSTSWILSATDSSGGSAFHATLEQRF